MKSTTMFYKNYSHLVIQLTVCFLIFFLTANANANEVEVTGQFPETSDPVLQSLLNEKIKNSSLQALINNKKVSITLVDISDINHPKVAHIDGDNSLYAASLPKLGILLAVFEEIHQGNLEMSSSLRKSLDMMIKESSNSEATRLYELVGAQRISEILTSDRYRFYDEEEGGGLWVGKPYGKGPAWKRSPLNNLSHGANGLQVARFYYMLERNQLTDPDYCPIMKDILADSSINHKFVKGLKSRRPSAEVYRKSGTWRDYHSDSALIEREDGITYIAVGIMQASNGGKLLQELIIDLDEVIDEFHKS